MPPAGEAAQFLPQYDPKNIRFRASKPISQAVAVLGGSPYSYFRYETHLAALMALDAYEDIATEFAQRFGRRHDAVACYRDEDAEFLFFMIGAFATKAMDAVDRLREAGIRAGLVRPRLLRPYPADALRRALKGKKAVGKGGILFTELASALYAERDAPLLASYVAGLGGRDISQEEFFEIARELRTAHSLGRAPLPRLLYTAEELRQVRKLQSVAAVEREEIGVRR